MDELFPPAICFPRAEGSGDLPPHQNSRPCAVSECKPAKLLRNTLPTLARSHFKTSRNLLNYLTKPE